MNVHHGSFYRAVITGYPEGSRITTTVRDLTEDQREMFDIYADEIGDAGLDDIVDLGPDPTWEPEGWLADPERLADWIEYHKDAKFFWPTDQKMWGTYRTAQQRARLLESYGASAKVVQSDPLHWPSDEELREREIAKLQGQIERLREVGDPQ